MDIKNWAQCRQQNFENNILSLAIGFNLTYFTPEDGILVPKHVTDTSLTFSWCSSLNTLIIRILTVRAHGFQEISLAK